MDANHYALHLDLDGAWRNVTHSFPTADATKWGPRLRFSTSPRAVEKFYREIQPHLGKFILYVSGAFHHLTPLSVRPPHELITLVSFKTHPVWDFRPPRWCCGG